MTSEAADEDEFYPAPSEACIWTSDPCMSSEAKEFQPRYTLSPEQIAKRATFRENLSDLTDALDLAYCTDACLVRYLRARNWNIVPAEKLLRNTLKWRREYGVDSIDLGEVEHEFCTGKNYSHGHDRIGRPVIYQRPRRENTKPPALQVRALCYILERVCGIMDPRKGVEQHVLVIDFKGYSLLNAPPMSVTKEVMTVLLDRYPERLGAAIFVDPPVLFYMTFRLVKPFLPAETQAKINFCKRDRHGRINKTFAKYFDPETLEEEYGGKLTSNYNHDMWVENETRIARQRQRDQAAATAAASVSSSSEMVTEGEKEEGEEEKKEKFLDAQSSATIASGLTPSSTSSPSILGPPSPPPPLTVTRKQGKRGSSIRRLFKRSLRKSARNQQKEQGK